MASEAEISGAAGAIRPVAAGGSTFVPPEGSNGRVFELGLVMAGAISAGAYTAGVIDFLIEALDDFEKMKATGKDGDQPYDGPRHSVMIPVMAGASAGGMTAAIAALQFFHEIDHVQPTPAGEKDPSTGPAAKRNRLYASWVRDIGIRDLLSQSDLDYLETAEGRRNGAVVKSVLCCDVLDRIVRDAFVFETRRDRDWIGGRGGQPLEIVLTTTNVGGVPYGIALQGASHASNAYGMLDHGDRLTFVVKPGATTSRPFVPHVDVDQLQPVGGSTSRDHDLFARAALATGAFPLGLSPRVVWRDMRSYQSEWKYAVQTPSGVPVPILPRFQAQPDLHRFVSLDGGMVDNEPLEAVRRFLADRNPRLDAAGKKLEHNERDGDQSDRAVVLIDPFPNLVENPPSDLDGEARFGLLSTLMAMVPLLTDQARFKPEELTLAKDGSVFSRFSITPSRKTTNDDGVRYPIASGALGGFSGFLSESFRRHDYLLGRRNAQAFLTWHLVLPRTNNVIFDGTAHGRWLVLGQKDDKGAYVDPKNVDLGGYKLVPAVVGADPSERAYPIIPLSTRLRQPIDIPAVDLPFPLSPAGTAQELKDLFESRFVRLARRIIDHELDDYMSGMMSFSRVRGWIAVGVAAMAAKRFRAEVQTALTAIRSAFT